MFNSSSNRDILAVVKDYGNTLNSLETRRLLPRQNSTSKIKLRGPFFLKQAQSQLNLKKVWNHIEERNSTTQPSSSDHHSSREETATTVQLQDIFERSASLDRLHAPNETLLPPLEHLEDSRQSYLGIAQASRNSKPRSRATATPSKRRNLPCFVVQGKTLEKTKLKPMALSRCSVLRMDQNPNSMNATQIGRTPLKLNLPKVEEPKPELEAELNLNQSVLQDLDSQSGGEALYFPERSPETIQFHTTSGVPRQCRKEINLLECFLENQQRKLKDKKVHFSTTKSPASSKPSNPRSLHDQDSFGALHHRPILVKELLMHLECGEPPKPPFKRMTPLLIKKKAGRKLQPLKPPSEA